MSCSIPKPPPPPPPPPVSLKILDQSEDFNSNLNQTLANNPLESIWAKEDPVLRRACIVSRICLDEPPHHYAYKSFKPIIQVGPTCGLAALSMLLYEMVSPDTMLSMAKSHRYTNHGEMLSCKDMGKLVRKVISLSGIDNLSYSVKQGDLNGPEAIECLMNGGCLLVPYDADVNHAPALKHGHTAHWCLVTGIIYINKPEDTNANLENIYVLCRHGKSQYLSAWKLSQLAESNMNLWEFSPKKQQDELEYIQPEGGLGGENGLRGQYILFNWINNNVSE